MIALPKSGMEVGDERTIEKRSTLIMHWKKRTCSIPSISLPLWKLGGGKF